jgi:hypothetical protein
VHDFRYYFTPLIAVLFTFPSRYLFTIGRQLVFSLTPWSAWIHAKFHVCRITQEFPRRRRVFGYGPVTLCGALFHTLHLTFRLPYRAPTTPGSKLPGLGCSAFARRYLRNHFRFLFLRLLRCFTSAGLALPPLCIQGGVAEYWFGGVTPFGNLRIIAYLPLPEAYRSISRPSSPSGSKASIMHS